VDLEALEALGHVEVLEVHPPGEKVLVPSQTGWPPSGPGEGGGSVNPSFASFVLKERKWTHFRAGTAKWVKRMSSRWERRQAKRLLKEALSEAP